MPCYIDLKDTQHLSSVYSANILGVVTMSWASHSISCVRRQKPTNSSAASRVSIRPRGESAMFLVYLTKLCLAHLGIPYEAECCSLMTTHSANARALYGNSIDRGSISGRSPPVFVLARDIALYRRFKSKSPCYPAFMDYSYGTT